MAAEKRDVAFWERSAERRSAEIKKRMTVAKALDRVPQAGDLQSAEDQGKSDDSCQSSAQLQPGTGLADRLIVVFGKIVEARPHAHGYQHRNEASYPDILARMLHISPRSDWNVHNNIKIPHCGNVNPSQKQP